MILATLIMATCLMYAGAALGLTAIGMLIVLLVREAPAGHEDRDGFHHDHDGEK